MVSLQERKIEDIFKRIEVRAKNFALILDEEEKQEILKEAVAFLNNIVSYPRHIYIKSPPREINLGDGIDTIANVVFSNDQSDMNSVFGENVAILPYLMGNGNNSMSSFSQYFLLLGNLNMIKRHMGKLNDWEFIAPNLYLNSSYSTIVVEFLPYLDPKHSSWYLFEPEYDFLINYTWALINIRNAEAIASGSYLGAGKEQESLLSYWKEKRQEIVDGFKKQEVITYVG